MEVEKATSEVQAPRLREGKLVPFFYLPAVGGGKSGPAALRSKYNMVLVFLEGGADSEAYLRELSGVYPDIEAGGARVIAVVARPLEETRDLAQRLQLPFAVLADEEGAKSASILGGGRAALCVADRFGMITYVEIRERASQLSSANTAVDWLEFVEILCPE
jgi:peroxiredoxin